MRNLSGKVELAILQTTEVASMTDTNEQLAALASLTQPCPGLKDGTPERSWHVGSIYDNEEHQLISDCPTCHGSGTEPLIAGLRLECPCLGLLKMDNSSIGWGRGGGCGACWDLGEHTDQCECHGLGWLPVSEQEAGWVLMECFASSGIWTPNVWWDSYRKIWEVTISWQPIEDYHHQGRAEGIDVCVAVIAAAYKAVIEHV